MIRIYRATMVEKATYICRYESEPKVVENFLDMLGYKFHWCHLPIFGIQGHQMIRVFEQIQ
jgi:hypothetical protein